MGLPGVTYCCSEKTFAELHGIHEDGLQKVLRGFDKAERLRECAFLCSDLDGRDEYGAFLFWNISCDADLGG